MKKSLCISGFLGLKTDWGFLDRKLFHVDAYRVDKLDGDLESAAKKINQSGMQSRAELLMGYSMGGRLALAALTTENSPFRAAVIFSAHLGLTFQQEKVERMHSDELWATRFEQWEWERLMREWQAQQVFTGAEPFYRSETNYNRSDLARVLRNFSLARQPDLRPLLKKVKTPILFVAGGKDEKYKKMAFEAAKLNPLFKYEEVSGCGHRVILESEKRHKKFK